MWLAEHEIIDDEEELGQSSEPVRENDEHPEFEIGPIWFPDAPERVLRIVEPCRKAKLRKSRPQLDEMECSLPSGI